MLRQEEEDKTESGWVLDESRGQLRRGETVRDEDFEDDFEMREGRERRQLMRSTSLTAPLSLRPAFARSRSQFQALDMPATTTHSKIRIEQH